MDAEHAAAVRRWRRADLAIELAELDGCELDPLPAMERRRVGGRGVDAWIEAGIVVRAILASIEAPHDVAILERAFEARGGRDAGEGMDEGVGTDRGARTGRRTPRVDHRPESWRALGAQGRAR